MRKLKFNNKLYSTMYTSGVNAVILGGGTFLTSYVAMNRMDPLITSTSIGVIALGSISTIYSSIKQKNMFVKTDDSNYDIYENIYNLDYLKMKSKELKKIESRYYIEQPKMNKNLQNIIKTNLDREKLLIKKAMESVNTDNPICEKECDLIIDLIIEHGYDPEYIEYKAKALDNIIELPINTKKSSNNNSNHIAKVLKFPENSN